MIYERCLGGNHFAAPDWIKIPRTLENIEHFAPWKCDSTLQPVCPAEQEIGRSEIQQGTGESFKS